jgi:tetratricopeptide (TPR) repeat protein
MRETHSFSRKRISLLWANIMVILLSWGMPQMILAETVPLTAPPDTAPLTQLQVLLAQRGANPSDTPTRLQLADLYLELGQDVYQEHDQKRQAFEEGSRLAKLVLDQEETNAEAHYLYAANLGSATQLSGVMASALTVNTLKTHVRRALELNPKHAPALHMMGMMLEELPWFLGGDKDLAITYLVRALEVKPDYLGARLDLAKIYMKRQNERAARAELLAILNQPSPSSVSESWKQDQREAQTLLNSLTIHH